MHPFVMSMHMPRILRQLSSHSSYPDPLLSIHLKIAQRCLFLTLPQRCIPRNLGIKPWMSMPPCVSKTFGEMVEHICVHM